MNIKKTKYILFYKNSSKDDTPLKILDLNIEHLNIEKNYSLKCFGTMLDDQISCRDQITTVESKTAKNVGLLHCARQVLTKASLKTIYFSYFCSYLNFSNNSWASANVIKLHKIHLLEK